MKQVKTIILQQR